jgi:hypothetical protein
MSMPDIQKGGKACRDHAANLRRKVKRGKELSADERSWLEGWEARVAAMPPGRPPGSGKSASDDDKDSQSGGESQPEGGGEKPGNGSPSPAEPPPPANVAADAPPIEPPPPVAKPAAPQADGKAGDWRAAHRKAIGFSDDGRQMICEQLAGHLTNGLGALCDDMKKAGIDPLVDPRVLRSLYVLALDDILPDRAKLTPKVGAALATITVVGQRAYHHKKITEALKDDPDVIAWKKAQAEREAKEQMARVAHEAEVKAGATVKQEAPKYAEPPEPPLAPERPPNGHAFNRNAPQPDPIRPEDRIV